MSGQVTGFAVASSKRNADFHALFPTLPEDDYLIETYTCAVNRDLLIQGRMYVSEAHLAFHSNIFGWVTSIVVPFAEIVSIEKRNTAYLIPNAISVRTLHARYLFSSLVSRDLTYSQLKDEVSKAANALESLGVAKGDRVAIYMPMIPEAVIAMLACARIGAPHSVVFGGFSADALRSRVDDAEAKLVVTADGSFRRGKPSMLKPAVDQALSAPGHTAEHVLVVRRNEAEVEMTEGRDLWWHDVVDGQSDEHELVWHDAEHPLYILYTSGTTGKPKGILHTTGGYLVQAAATHHDTFDLHPESDVFWCTADVGWVTGHSYVAYAPLVNGATQVIYEGTPDSPHQGRWWEIVQKYGVSILYTAPTAIRTFMKWGRHIPDEYDLSSLRVLGSVGEAINPEAWRWYHEVIGAGRCPIVDTWWQTETGAHMLTPLPGVTTLKPGSAQRPVPGVVLEVVDELGEPMTDTSAGFLVVREPWPSMLRGIWGDPERYKDTYWSRFGPEYYFAGDGAKYDSDGDLWLLGRVDEAVAELKAWWERENA